MQAIAHLLANTPKMSGFDNALTVSRLGRCYRLSAVSVLAICGILVGNLRHIGEQYAAYYLAICVFLLGRKPSLTTFWNIYADLGDYL